MKRIVPFVLVVAVLLTAAGLLLRHNDPAKAYTESAEAWAAYEEGERLLQSFRHAQADTLLRLALARDPQLAPAHAALSELALRLGQAERTDRHRAIADSLADRIEDRRGRVLLQLRLAGQRESRYFAGRDSLLELARRLAPRQVAVLAAEAQRAAEEDDVARAEAAWQEILEVNANFASAYNSLGYLYLNQGRYAEAEAAMRRYAYVAPDLANPHDSLGEVLMTVGRYEEAEKEFWTALDKQPDFYYSQTNLIQIYLARGQVAKAVDLIEQMRRAFAGTALERSFERTTSQRFIFHRLHDLAASALVRYLAQETDPHARGFAEVRLLICRAEPVAALAILDSLVADHQAAPWYPDQPTIDRQVRYRLLAERAVAAEHLGLHQAAADLLREALQSGADLPPHALMPERIRFAYNLVPLGRLDEARAAIRAALTINPRIAEALLVAAAIEAADDRPTEALRLLDAVQHVLQFADDAFPALVDARRLRERLGDPDHI